LGQTIFQRGLTRLSGKGDSTLILFQVQQSYGEVQMDMTPKKFQRKKMHMFLERQQSRIQSCHGLDKLWKWNVVCFGMFVMNDGALRAVKKLYVRLCAARDKS
jgi:hypothetical protein